MGFLKEEIRKVYEFDFLNFLVENINFIYYD